MAGARRVKDCEAIRKLMDDKEIAVRCCCFFFLPRRCLFLFLEQPDRDTFIMMLDAYCRVQDVDKAMNMLNILREQVCILWYKTVFFLTIYFFSFCAETCRRTCIHERDQAFVGEEASGAGPRCLS